MHNAVMKKHCHGCSIRLEVLALLLCCLADAFAAPALLLAVAAVVVHFVAGAAPDVFPKSVRLRVLLPKPQMLCIGLGAWPGNHAQLLCFKQGFVLAAAAAAVAANPVFVNATGGSRLL